MKRILTLVICSALLMLWVRSLTAEQNISSESPANQYNVLISDNIFLHSASVLSFDVQAFLDTLPGPLKDYSEDVEDQSWSAAIGCHFWWLWRRQILVENCLHVCTRLTSGQCSSDKIAPLSASFSVLPSPVNSFVRRSSTSRMGSSPCDALISSASPSAIVVCRDFEH